MLKVEYNDFKSYVLDIGLLHLVRHVTSHNTVYLAVDDGGMHLTAEIGSHQADDLVDFEAVIKPYANNPRTDRPPFADKNLSTGKSLFSRPEGREWPLVAGANTLDFPISYPIVKFNEIEVFSAEKGDTVDLKILDTSTGTYSGVANHQFNQFSNSLNVKKDEYIRRSEYDADLYQGMRIVMEYNSKSAKTIEVNYIIHEVK